jgi:phenylpropionate dioxygenase-like ring-hydroxylating dioxygenase large terminal subunit
VDRTVAGVNGVTSIPTLPASSYLDPEVWDDEVRDVFRAGWVPVCRADRIPEVGDRYATTIAGHPVVAVRDQDGVRVLTNVCRHRWSTVVDPGCSHGRNLVCPYHRWSYALDGHLQAAPLTNATDLDGVALPEVRHELWLGFVMVNLDGTAPPVAESLAGLTEQLAPWRVDELVTAGSRTFSSTWNWKVMVENWIECYHHIGAHRTTVEPWQPARSTKVVDADGPWAFMTVDTDAEIIGTPDEWSVPHGDEEAKLLTVWAAFPFLLGGTQSRFAFWLELTVRSVDRHDVTWHVLAHPDQLDAWSEGEAEGLLDLLAEVHQEDIASCRRVDEGLRSGALETGRLVELEAPIAHFHRWLRTATPT